MYNAVSIRGEAWTLNQVLRRLYPFAKPMSTVGAAAIVSEPHNIPEKEIAVTPA